MFAHYREEDILVNLNFTKLNFQNFRESDLKKESNLCGESQITGSGTDSEDLSDRSGLIKL